MRHPRTKSANKIKIHPVIAPFGYLDSLFINYIIQYLKALNKK